MVDCGGLGSRALLRFHDLHPPLVVGLNQDRYAVTVMFLESPATRQLRVSARTTVSRSSSANSFTGVRATDKPRGSAPTQVVLDRERTKAMTDAKKSHASVLKAFVSKASSSTPLVSAGPDAQDGCTVHFLCVHRDGRSVEGCEHSYRDDCRDHPEKYGLRFAGHGQTPAGIVSTAVGSTELLRVSGKTEYLRRSATTASARTSAGTLVALPSALIVAVRLGSDMAV